LGLGFSVAFVAAELVRMTLFAPPAPTSILGGVEPQLTRLFFQYYEQTVARPWVSWWPLAAAALGAPLAAASWRVGVLVGRDPAVVTRDIAGRQRCVAEEIDRRVREDDAGDDPAEGARPAQALRERDRATRGDDREPRQHREDVAVLADVDEHVERKRRERPDEKESRPPAIAQLDPPRLRGKQQDRAERDEEIQAPPEKAPELIRVSVDRDRTVAEHAVPLVHEGALY